MRHSYNHRVTTSATARLNNLLASLSLNLAGDAQQELERVAGLTGSAAVALLALDEFAGDAHVARLADLLGVTHSGAVRLVAQLESMGLAERRHGADRRRVEVRLTANGRRRARAARRARDAVTTGAFRSLTSDERRTLELLLAKMVGARVADRLELRQAGARPPWWCRTCEFAACGRPDGRCPAQASVT
jgi:DNA-binding MarR family transcriptional regulator